MTNPRLLCVDDEPNVLEGIKRHLRRDFEVVTASGGEEALAILGSQDPFAVIVSDLRMPGMNGIEFLSRASEVSAETTRILLTGDADLSAAIDAVNHGSLFRFLTKPCGRDVLIPVIRAGVKHHELVSAERELLQKTLHGTVALLTEALALARPEVFGQARRLARRAKNLAHRMQLAEPWKVELAAMMSEIAYSTLPPETLSRVKGGEALSDDEQRMVARLPEISERLLADVPRIADVQRIVAGAHRVADSDDEEEAIRLAAQAIRAVGHVTRSVAGGETIPGAIGAIRKSASLDRTVLECLEPELFEDGDLVTRCLQIEELRSGMQLLEDIKADDGTLLVSSGQELSLGMLERIRNFSENRKITGKFEVGVAA